MKIAVISDIHGNYPALLTVTDDLEQWRPDLIVVAGDIVNRGPCSLACWQFVKEKADAAGWQVIKGNHEDYVLDCLHSDSAANSNSLMIKQYAQWTLEQVKPDIALIAQLPDQFTYIPSDQAEMRVVHASMRNNRDGVYPHTTDADLRQQIIPPPSIFVTAHTHRPLLRQVDDTLVVNVGSVGSPFDEDKRAGYGRFTWHQTKGWQAEIRRVPYDWCQTEKDYVSSGFLEEGGPLAQLMLVELRKSRGLIYRWAGRYEAGVLAGSLTLDESVLEILKDEDVRPFTGPPGWVIN